MAFDKKVYWKGPEEYTNDTEFVKRAGREFNSSLEEGKSDGADNPLSLESLASSRRDFLKIMGFSLTAATLASCEAPLKKAIPILNKPDTITPTIPNYYASAFVEGGDFVSVLVKTREGRPIKIEGNNLSKVTFGGTTARAQASVLSLYDTARYRAAQIAGKDAAWKAVDELVTSKLASATKIALVSNTTNSTVMRKVIADFKSKYANTELFVYDAISAYGIAKANELTFGKAFVPDLDFSKAKVIVTFGADFLGTWLLPTRFTKQFSQTRKLGGGRKEMSRLIALEAQMSLTGCNADWRIQLKPSAEGIAIANLYNILASKVGAPVINTLKSDQFEKLEKIANELLSAKGESLVVSGSNDAQLQVLVNAINNLLQNYGKTIFANKPLYVRNGDDAKFANFVDGLSQGQYQAVIFLDSNPAYDSAWGEKITKALQAGKIFTVSTAYRPDETASLCSVVAPNNHTLESWNDANPIEGHFNFIQPAISPLFDTRQAEASLMAWATGKSVDMYDYVTEHWYNAFGKFANGAGKNVFINKLLHNGVYETGDATLEFPLTEGLAVAEPAFNYDVAALGTTIAQNYSIKSDKLELFVYEKVGIGSGKDVANPWLLEFADPVSRACWENYATISVSTAKKLGIDVIEGLHTVKVKLSANGYDATLPVLIQPGQAPDTIGIALGFGRTVAGKSALNVGVDAYKFLKPTTAGVFKYAKEAKLEITTEKYSVAHVQTHHTVMGRPIIQEATLAEYKKDEAAGRVIPMIATNEGAKKPTDISIWDGHATPNHNWGMVIDLNSCTGCGACTVACQAENNVAVVGKQEVINRREMAWIRIDRYYSSDADPNDRRGLEDAADNPAVVFQPMMCQHCQNAPCETVCPVVATTHSTEGLNQMTYNRCVGTRYCANNCPYKVRRFNWFSYYQNEKFDFNMNSDLGRMVLNPDVTVRARGVMEKCSMCIQRIQEGKLVAKKEKRRPHDGEIKTACQQACAADAIVFGDMNDPKSAISMLLKQEEGKRAYTVLEEINVRPNVSYLTKIRNHTNVNNKA